MCHHDDSTEGETLTIYGELESLLMLYAGVQDLGSNSHRSASILSRSDLGVLDDLAVRLP